MAQIIHDLYNPESRTRPQGRSHYHWYSTLADIDANELTYLEVNLRRLKLLEQLRVVPLFIFQATREKDLHVMIEGKIVLQNQWVYDKVVKVIPVDRAMVFIEDRMGFLAMLENHRELEVMRKPTYYHIYKTNKRLPEGKTFL